MRPRSIGGVAVGLLTLLSSVAVRADESTPTKEAIAKSLALLEASSRTWMERAPCASCHHQSLPAIAFGLAKSRGFRIDAVVEAKQADKILARWGAQREGLFQGFTGDINGQVINASYALVGLAAAAVPANATTDAMAHYILARQLSDGRFRSTNANRPPLEYSDVSATAMAIRALQSYAPPGRHADTAAIIVRARHWLLTTVPRGTEEKSFQLRGLAWAGAEPDEIASRAAALAAEQRADGGWAQLPDLQSDAYATGQTLAALHQTGSVSPTSQVYRRGVEFLLNMQRDDGSWLVVSRARGTQPYFESGFPHGTNQFISAAGTAWATIALLLSLGE